MSPASDGGSDTSLSREEMYSLLASRWRRYTLYCLFVYTTPVSLATVADTVAEFEHGVPAETIPDERLTVYMRLYHTHVPKLASAGVVDYDQSEDTLSPDTGLAQLEPYLRADALDDLDDHGSWPIER
ncbi:MULTISPECIES: DUF7344 domain-containing protein [Haloarcula]|uniref:DUF7344 domain-containing protein n=1 Tax=Haloarcula pellucida TaxID=1427151 RepID=A0A830GHR3_9EURY|nr:MULTISPECIES: hypothetical protein [Halomicroarcula]MBX0347189.1 hypothetical protein [Halomicroarcula pellucida]MDS0276937.1 hypothetical protein [Halomicroarcula sp. S1AR25-4]GGN87432.1 hypothetical protein GCM10009030_06100 [Halomicroarcula pellucida]